jgi:hypothetical protein
MKGQGESHIPRARENGFLELDRPSRVAFGLLSNNHLVRLDIRVRVMRFRASCPMVVRAVEG